MALVVSYVSPWSAIVVQWLRDDGTQKPQPPFGSICKPSCCCPLTQNGRKRHLLFYVHFVTCLKLYVKSASSPPYCADAAVLLLTAHCSIQYVSVWKM